MTLVRGLSSSYCSRIEKSVDLNPNPAALPELDPKDQFLLLDLNTSAASYGASGSGTSTPTSVANVSWLRKTDHREREVISRVAAPQETYDSPRTIFTRYTHALCRKYIPEASIDVSHAAQIKDIEASFASLEDFDLTALKHPNKRNVTAVESFEVLPDADIWANAYDLFRFSERPGDRARPLEVIKLLYYSSSTNTDFDQEDDPRLDCAVLRPMESDGDHFLAYYLTKEDQTAVEFKEARMARPVNGEQDEDEEVNKSPLFVITKLNKFRRLHSILCATMKSCG